MRLCDSKRERGHRKRSPDETTLEFLYRSDRPEIPPICRLLEDWFNAYPSHGQEQLRRRLSSHNDNDVHSAFFELYLFTLLRKLRFDVEVPHPTAVGQKTEDFRAFREDKLVFRLEAKYAGQEEQHAWQDRFQQQLQHSLDKAQADGIWFLIRIRGDFCRQPAPARVRQRFERWYEQHRNQLISALAAGDSGDSLPQFRTEEAGAKITVAPMFLKSDQTRSGGPVGLWSRGGRWMQTDDKLRRGLKRKASRYGTMKVPFIIALSSYEVPDEFDIGNTLFGDEVFTIRISRGGPAGAPTPSRKRNGFWLGPKGPQNRRVSAVLLVSELFPWSVADREPVIYHNPWASRPLSRDAMPITQMLPDGDESRYERQHGQPICQILGLPQSWPRNDKQ